MKNLKSQKSKNAFSIIQTLIAICLVSLFIFGIFFSKKMVRENNVKSLIMQIKKYDSALNAFTEKYHALPGDVQNTVTFGITDSSSDGNGDNIITDRSQKIMSANGEISNFWMHLSKSKMLDENYDGKEDSEAKVTSTFPASKISEKTGIVAFGDTGKTFYQIGFDFASSDRLYTKNRCLKTDEAFLFDKKVDDGNPKKGRVIVVGGDALNLVMASECTKYDEYNQSLVSPACQLRIEAK